MPAAAIADLLACMIAENILVADSMDAWYLVATSLAKDEVEQSPLCIEEGII